MLFLITKYAITAFIIVVASEVAKRSDKWGALISSLPFVTMMIMIWLYVEKQSSEKIAMHALYTFCFVIPTLPMFLLMPWMLKQEVGFGSTLLAGILLTFLCFVICAWIGKSFNIHLF
jgi:F0F1-type ATP synthase assembly protein I